MGRIEELMRKSFVTPWVVLALAIWGSTLTSCARPAKVQARDTAPADIPTVPVARVSSENLSRGLVLTAEFKPFQEVDVMAKVAGYISKINVDVGDRVHQGDLLATLEVPEMADDLRRARAALDRSEAEVARARDELRRAESAHELAHLSFERLSGVAKKKPGLIAQQEIDDARSKDLVSEAQVSAAKSALAAANEQVGVNQAEMQKVQTMIQYTRVTAPFTGVITKRYADTGSMIQAGTASQSQAMPVVRLSENSLLRLILPVPGIVCAGRPSRATSRGASPHAAPELSRESGALRGSAFAVNAHHGYRGRRAQSEPGADSRHVCGSEPHARQPEVGSGDPRDGGGHRSGELG